MSALLICFVKKRRYYFLEKRTNWMTFCIIMTLKLTRHLNQKLYFGIIFLAKMLLKLHTKHLLQKVCIVCKYTIYKKSFIKNDVIYDMTLFYGDRFREGNSNYCYYPDDPDLPSFSLSK